MTLTGMHHYTAVTGDAPGNVAFYTRVLGMRLVLKTVNQDDLSAYHLFYGDTRGEAGSEVTFFDWPHAGRNRSGSGTIAAIGLRVAGSALVWWASRFASLGVLHEAIVERAGRRTLAFSDPEGQRLVLIDDGATPEGTPWAGGPVPPEMGIYGLGAPHLVAPRAEPAAWMLGEALGFSLAGAYTDHDDGQRVEVYTMGAGGAAAEIHLSVRPDLPPGVVGIGGVHHVCFRTPDDASLAAWRERLLAAGLQPTGLIDRQFHHMIYVREPGGILFEIATDGPGFAAFEDPAHLGERLVLPAFLEPRRARIEAGLRPLPTPVTSGSNAPARVASIS
jgi:glyoxalase family protein